MSFFKYLYTSNTNIVVFRFCHEMALRILLRTIDSHANRYSRYIVPLLSLSIDFYCRVFVRVHFGQAKVKDSAAKLAHVYHCVGCGTFAFQPLVTKTLSSTGRLTYSVATGPPVDSRCIHCGGRHAIGGPVWTAPLHDVAFVQRVIDNVSANEEKIFKTQSRIVGMLSVVTEELQDQPLYFDMDELCRIVHCTAVGFLPLRSVYPTVISIACSFYFNVFSVFRNVAKICLIVILLLCFSYRLVVRSKRAGQNWHVSYALLDQSIMSC